VESEIAMKVRILFIGNSYTYANDMPGIVAELAKSRGRNTDILSVCAGGKTLEWHLKSKQTIDSLLGSRWDFVILQEQSLRPIEAPEKMISSVEMLADLARRQGAEPALYLTWARQHKPATQDAIDTAYAEAAKLAKARIAPVGPAWQIAISKKKDLCLYTNDKSHPNMQGSYLAACVIYSTLFQESPEDLPFEPMLDDAKTARLLQKCARKACGL